MQSKHERPQLSGPFPVRLFEADYNQLHEIARAKDRKIASIVRRAVADYLAKESPVIETSNGASAIHLRQNEGEALNDR